MYKKATQQKLRFDTPVGSITVEDLWDLKLEMLDELAIKCQEEAQSSSISFIKKDAGADPIAKLRFEIVKDVIETRLEMIEQSKLAALNKEKKQKILEIISKKQDATLEEASVDDLKAMLESL